jgi:hypothetical protein
VSVGVDAGLDAAGAAVACLTAGRISAGLLEWIAETLILVFLL